MGQWALATPASGAESTTKRKHGSKSRSPKKARKPNSIKKQLYYIVTRLLLTVLSEGIWISALEFGNSV